LVPQMPPGSKALLNQREVTSGTHLATELPQMPTCGHPSTRWRQSTSDGQLRQRRSRSTTRSLTASNSRFGRKAALCMESGGFRVQGLGSFAVNQRLVRIIGVGVVTLIVVAFAAYAIAQIGSGSGRGLTESQVRPALVKLPLGIQLRQSSLEGTKTVFDGQATRRRDGAMVTFTVFICDDRSCSHVVFPAISTSVNDLIIGTGWAFMDNGRVSGHGHTRSQGIAISQQVFLALCHTAHDPCY
jgi:hypothetical protein